MTVTATSRPAILLVDDVPTNLEVLAGALDKDYDLSFALSGPEALDLIARNPPDLVLLDVMMPDMSGHEVLRRLRADPGTRDLPVIFVTADTSEASELEGLTQGADDYLVKPVLGPVLHARVANLLARRSLERALRASEARYAALAAAAPVAILRLDAKLGCHYANALWSALTDTGAESDWLRAVHPDDRDAVRQALIGNLETGSPFQREFRLQDGGGAHWVYGQAAPLAAREGADAGLVLTLTDIGARKAAESTLAARERELEVLIGAMDDVVVTLDADSRVRTFHCPRGDSPFCALADPVGRDFAEALPAPLAERLAEVLPGLIADPAPVGREFELDDGRGGQRCFHAIFSPLRDGAGWPTGFLCVARDITQRKAMETELERLATTDALTGVANRRRFMEQAEAELRRVHRFHTPAALLMLDIDHFKRVNDTYGHAIGDTVLRHLARLAESRLRSSDLFGRLGGEEFAILLPGADLDGAADFADQFRQYVADHPAATDSGPVGIRISIGVSPFLAEDEDCETILARADAALYRAKGKGRDRVEIHRP